MLRKFGLKGSGESLGQGTVSGGNGSRGVLDWLWFSCGVARGGAQQGGLISFFRGFSASVGKAFLLVGRLGAGLSFYAVWKIS